MDELFNEKISIEADQYVFHFVKLNFERKIYANLKKKDDLGNNNQIIVSEKHRRIKLGRV